MEEQVVADRQQRIKGEQMRRQRWRTPGRMSARASEAGGSYPIGC